MSVTTAFATPSSVRSRDGLRKLLAAGTILPIAYIPAFLGLFFLAMPTPGMAHGGGFPAWFGVFMVVHMAVALISLAVQAGYILLAATNDELPMAARLFWIVMFLMFSFIAFPFYYFSHARRQLA
jgi:hypothetical protein